MASLLDIVPPAAEVVVGGRTITVHGVSAGGIASLLARFPRLRDLLSGSDVESADLMSLGGEIVAAIIAAGCGFPGNADAERVASLLPLGQQADVLSAIIEQTMPGGSGPLVEQISRLAGALGLNVSGNEPSPNQIAATTYRNGHDQEGSTEIYSQQ